MAASAGLHGGTGLPLQPGENKGRRSGFACAPVGRCQAPPKSPHRIAPTSKLLRVGQPRSAAAVTSNSGKRRDFVPEGEKFRLVLLDLGKAAERLEEVVVGEVVIDLRDFADEDGSR